MSISQILLLIAAIAAMMAIVPLMVWGGSGDWRRALQALREYSAIIFGAFIIVGGFAAIITLVEFIDR